MSPTNSPVTLKRNIEVQTIQGNEDEGHGYNKSHRTFVTLEGFPRKNLPSASDAEKRYKRAILEASAELSQDFHTTYLDKVVKGNLGQKILDIKNPSTSYETLKKGFLFYLNGSGKYLILREHLREAVISLLHQKSLTNHVNGFKTREQYQSFLHESYSYLLDGLNDALHSTAYEEGSGHGILKCTKNSKKDVRSARHLRDMLLYAQEAFALGDYENAHRLHTERIARSGDDDNCWIDFALMWLSRGDDRLAEIAVRESLTKNPMNLVGLLLAGLIAGRHRDERGIAYMEALLKHRPLCPELHVLMGIVQSYCGNQVVAESYYDMGRKLHGTLTVPKPVTRPTDPPPEEEVVKIENSKARESQESGESGKSKRKKSDGSQGSKEKTKKISQSSENKDKKKHSTGGDSVGGNKHSKERIRRATKIGKGSTGGASAEGGDTVRKISHKSDKNKRSVADGGDDIIVIDQSPPKSAEHELRITKMNVGGTKPPMLSNDIFVTWNVTKKPVKKLQAPEFGIPGYTNHGIYGDSQEIHHQFHTALETNTEKLKHGNSMASIGVKRRSSRRNHHLHVHRHHKRTNTPYIYPTIEENYDHSIADEQVGEDNNQPAEHVSTTTRTIGLQNLADVSEPSIYSKRFGSELLWTAHLLLKLRQFEFLDLILAKEISRGDRSLQYLYLRAVSLYLRGRNAQALHVINEALTKNPKHATFWILKGNAQFKLHHKEPALESYQQAMMLPHGKESLHLPYMRFGTLCIDKGDAQLAKRVLLKRVTVAPSPYLWILVGNACFQLGELDDALHAFSEANKLDSTNPVIWAHLSLVSLKQGNQNLAEQSYKWAIRFGLKKGKLMEDIKELHRKLGFGDPAFSKLPHCIPHEVFVQRLGRETPIEIYAESLNFPHLKNRRNKFENRDSEEELIKELHKKDTDRMPPSGTSSHNSRSAVDELGSKGESSVKQLVEESVTSLRSKRSLGVGKKTKGSKHNRTSATTVVSEKRRHKSRRV